MRTTLFILSVFFSVTLFGQTNDRVGSIRKTVDQINTDTAYKKKILVNEQWMEQMTDEGGALTGYFKNGQLLKIIEYVGLSSCTSIYEYYLQDTTLIFVYGQEKVFKYNESLNTFDPNIQTVAMECRFYFDKGKLIKSKVSGQPRCSDIPTDADSTNLLADCKKYLGQLSK
jgi:hypothetical protein